MLPRDNVYGEWPASGESASLSRFRSSPSSSGPPSLSLPPSLLRLRLLLPTADARLPLAVDIAESRGNRVQHSWDRTVNAIGSALHWGLDAMSDRYKSTQGQFMLKRHYADEVAYTYGLDWDPKGMRFWSDTGLRADKRVNFNQPFWDRGSLSSVQVNGSIAVNPWTSAEVLNAAPFDQDFYLILSVAVGGTNGWFPDSGDKPWSNNAPVRLLLPHHRASRARRADPALSLVLQNAARDFWNNRAKWQPTWPEDPKERGMVVESVKVWRIAEPGETCAA